MLFDALRDHWPGENQAGLQLMVAMCVGITRLSLEAWRRDAGHRELREHVQDYLEALDETFQPQRRPGS